MVLIPYEDMFALTIFSVHPLDGVISFMPEFFNYVIVITLFIVILFTLIATRIIVHPILTINRVAQNMSSLNFSERLPIRSNDEIGMISNSINSMANELEIALRTHEEKNKALSHDLMQKEKLQLALKQFVADVSHELKTPLSIIHAYTERLEDKHLTDMKGKKYTQVILDENQKMTQLIYNLLELSKLESETYILNRTLYDFNEEIMDTLERFLPLIQEKQLHLTTEITDQGLIYADQELMHLVTNNLMSNAIKHAPALGSIHLSLKIQDHDLVFCIRNSTENMDQIKLDRLWDRFYKADHSRNRDKGGFGLGLSITKSVLDLHGYDCTASFDKDMIQFCFTIKKKAEQ